MILKNDYPSSILVPKKFLYTTTAKKKLCLLTEPKKAFNMEKKVSGIHMSQEKNC